MQTQMTNTGRTPVRREELESRLARQESALLRVVPPVDIYENKDEILLVAEMPGARKDELRVDFSNDTLTMICPRDLQDSGVALVTELWPAEYFRSFLVPRGIDTQMISAELKDGVLRIHLPKSESLKPRQIQVSAG